MYTLLKPRRGHRYWGVRICLPGQPPLERSTKCARKTEARTVAERLHADAVASATAVTLGEAIGLLIGMRVRQKRSPATIRKLEQKSLQLLRFFGEARDVNSLRVTHTIDYVIARRAARISDSTIAMEVGTLRAALRYLRRLEKYSRDPGALWPDELPHGSGIGERWLTWQEYLLTLAALDAEFRDHFTVYCATGIRYVELYRIHAADLVRAVEGWELRVRGTKTAGAARTVSITEDALEVLQRRSLATPSGPLFPETHGNAKAQQTAWYRALRAALRAAGLKTASTNDLRRTFATWARDRGADESVVAAWLGHSAKSQMLRRVYVKIPSSTHAREGAKLPSRRGKSVGGEKST